MEDRNMLSDLMKSKLDIPKVVLGNVDSDIKKKEIAKEIDHDVMRNFIYVNMLLADKIEDYLVSMVYELEESPVFKFRIKKSVKNIKEAWNLYRKESYLEFPEDTQYAIAEILDHLDDALGSYFVILYSQLYQYFNTSLDKREDKHFDTLRIAFTKASLVKLLADFYLLRIKSLNGKTFVNGIQMSLIRDDKNIRMISKSCQDLIKEIGPRLSSDTRLDVAKSENIQQAFNNLLDKLKTVSTLVKSVQV